MVMGSPASSATDSVRVNCWLVAHGFVKEVIRNCTQSEDCKHDEHGSGPATRKLGRQFEDASGCSATNYALMVGIDMTDNRRKKRRPWGGINERR